MQKFDFLASFLNMNVPEGQNYCIQTLAPGDFEYKMLETGFQNTKNQGYSTRGGGLFGGGGRIGGNSIDKVLKIEKIMNNNIFDKFSLELRKTLKKYP